MSISFPIEWQINESPLEPQGVITAGLAASALVNRLTELSEEKQQKLKIVTSKNHLIVLGQDQYLPWVEKGEFIAPSPYSFRLWLPIHKRPTLPNGLVEQALIQHVKREPLLLLSSPQKVIPLDNQFSLTPKLLKALSQLSFNQD